ncbi:MAG: glycosyltransferase [Gemmataceae bacterium]|nr:glycosyltransferase [Gemmataceae bacterium]
MRDILQNQDSFVVPAYRARTAALVEVLRARWPAPDLWARLRRSPWASGLLMFLCARGFRVAVTIGHRPALVFGALSRLLGRGNVLHIAKEFYIEEAADTPRGGWRGLLQRLKRAVYRWALKDVTVLVVNARAECDAYARFFDLPRERVLFFPWPSNIDEPRWHREHDGTIVAGGRSLRDWRTYFQAVEGLPYRFLVGTPAGELRGLTVPANVNVLDLPRERYLERLRRALFAVVPLIATPRATGQATFLECMACGKPVIVTKVAGSVDYVRHEENGLLVPPADSLALRREIVRLAEDRALRDRLALGGLRSIREEFNRPRHARDMLELIDQLLEGGLTPLAA